MRRFLVIALVLAAMLLSSCSGTQSTPTTQPAAELTATTAAVAEPTAPEATEAPAATEGLSGSCSWRFDHSTAVAEELAEAFMAANPDVSIEIQGGGSSVGVTSAGEGTVDIGNASREVRPPSLTVPSTSGSEA